MLVDDENMENIEKAEFIREKKVESSGKNLNFKVYELVKSKNI